MDFGHYRNECAQAAADLVNTKGSISGNEYLPTPDAVAEFVVAHGLAEGGVVTAADPAALQEFRERLRGVFTATDETAAAARLNDLLADLDVRPHLTDHDGHWHLHYSPDDAPVSRKVAAATATALALLIADQGFGRLGVCSADDCRDVYVDTSRNRSRRYCNDICSSRMNVAAYRARHKHRDGAKT